MLNNSTNLSWIIATFTDWTFFSQQAEISNILSSNVYLCSLNRKKYTTFFHPICISAPSTEINIQHSSNVYLCSLNGEIYNILSSNIYLCLLNREKYTIFFHPKFISAHSTGRNIHHSFIHCLSPFTKWKNTQHSFI